MLGKEERVQHLNSHHTLLDYFTCFQEEGFQLVDSKGQAFARFPVLKGFNGSFTAEYEILRGDLSKLLYEASKDMENVDYRFGVTVKQVLSNDEKSVRLRLSDGSESEYDMVVAADGQWSPLRKMAFPSSSVKIKDFGLMVAYWTAPRTERDNNWWSLYFGLGRKKVSLRPDPYGNVRAVFTIMPRTQESKELWKLTSRKDKEAQKALLKTGFKDVGWESQRLLDSLDGADDFYFQVTQQIKMSRWWEGRIICLGDTAHAPTSLTGMGTSLAILSPFVLAGELSKLEEGERPEVAFQKFEDLFRPFVEQIQKVPSIVPGVVHPNTKLQRWGLRLAFYLGSKVFKIYSFILPWTKSSATKDEPEDFKLPQYGLPEEKNLGSTVKNNKKED